ncbi:transposase [Desulfovirgula thermocuniculi]|uniref:transposase n=1 Tax=Desulfovirgula thermocuniculi TaxID=348842 RepID=UPI00047FEC19|nr:transposase [Desulfovirgula thermocuniculi]
MAKVFPGHRHKKTEHFHQLQLHYLFTPEFCLPYAAHEKGLVENAVRLIRNNFFVPVPKVQSLEEINEKLEQWCRKYMEQYLPEKEATV